MKLDTIVGELDELLRTSEIKDYPNALNGLEVQNEGEVTKIAVAVDACEAVLEMAVEAGADLLIVHHGLFWGGLTTLTGPAYRKFRICLEGGLAVYSSHLPLDQHPDCGNNALLCDALNFPMERQPFLEIGWQVEREINREVLHTALEAAVGGRVHMAPGGPITTKRIGVVTGGAGREIFKAAAAGVDTFITGEGPHDTYTAAEELGINLYYAGHYATETFGVKALGEIIEKEHGLPWVFLDHPTGL